jgi:hypothetical protein
VDCSDEHFREARDVAERFAHPADYPLLEFSGGFVSERKRNDVTRRQAAAIASKQMHNPLCNYFSFPRTSAGNELDVCVRKSDRFFL